MQSVVDYDDPADVFKRDGHLWLRVDYDEEFIEAIKDALPPHYRGWDPATARWVIPEQFERTVRHLVRQVYSYVLPRAIPQRET